MADVARPLLPVIAAVALLAGGCRSGSPPGGSSLPAPVPSGAATVEKPATVVPDDSGIPGVVAYDTKGWPANSGPPDAGALPHDHAPGPVTYSVTPPVGGDHNGTWMNCGAYPRPVPAERAVHNLEHGAV